MPKMKGALHVRILVALPPPAFAGLVPVARHVSSLLTTHDTQHGRAATTTLDFETDHGAKFAGPRVERPRWSHEVDRRVLASRPSLRLASRIHTC